MKLTHAVRYDAPIADVYAMLTDPVFREEAAWAQQVSTVEAGEVRIDMVQPNTASLIRGQLKDGWDTEHVVGTDRLAGER